MAKLTLDTVTGGYDLSVINNNFDKIETAIENTLSRDGTAPNTLEDDLDVNGNRLYNVASLSVGSLSVGGQTVVPGDVNITGIEERENYAAIRAYTGTEVTFYVKGHTLPLDGGAGVFRYDASDTTSADNGVTILVDALSRRWKREFVGPAYVEWGGALPGAADNAAAIQRVMDACSEVWISDYTFMTKAPLRPNTGQRIKGPGTIKGAADFVGAPWYVTFSSEQRYANIIFLCDGVEDVEIRDIGVDGTLLPTATGYIRRGVVFYHYEVGVYKERFVCDNVRFTGVGVAGYCNVKRVTITNNTIKDCTDGPSLSFETIYPGGGATPYQYPIGLYAANNRIDTALDSETVATVWLSGFQDVVFENNEVNARGDLILVYCNDLSVGIKDARIEGNTLYQKATTTNSRHPVTVMGRSYASLGTSNTFEVQGVVVQDNTFGSATNYSAQNTSQPAGVAAWFAGDIVIRKNKIRNFYHGVSLDDKFSSTYSLNTRAKVDNNEFDTLGAYPVKFTNGVKSCKIRRNTFKDWGKQLTTFDTRSCLDIRRIKDVSVLQNTFVVTDSGVTRERLIYASQAVRAWIEGNINETAITAEVVFTGRDSLSVTHDKAMDRLTNRTQYRTLGRLPFGTFKVGDTTNYSNTPFVSGPNSYVESVCTAAGVSASAFSETATGTAGNDFFTFSSASGELRFGQTVTINGNSYTITDIDYHDLRATVSPVLATTFSGAAITASGPTWKDTVFYV